LGICIPPSRFLAGAVVKAARALSIRRRERLLAVIGRSLCLVEAREVVRCLLSKEADENALKPIRLRKRFHLLGHNGQDGGLGVKFFPRERSAFGHAGGTNCDQLSEGLVGFMQLAPTGLFSVGARVGKIARRVGLEGKLGKSRAGVAVFVRQLPEALFQSLSQRIAQMERMR